MEAGYDFVIVNNVAFSGSSTPHGKVGMMEMTSPEQDRDEWWTSSSQEKDSHGKNQPQISNSTNLENHPSPMKDIVTSHDINGDLYGNRPNER